MTATPVAAGRDERSVRLAGIGLMLAGVGLFSFNDALGKYLVGTYSVGQLMLFRAVVALVLIAPFIWRARAEFKAMPRPGVQLLRVVLSAAEVAAFFAATVYLPLADVITFYLAAPIFVTALSAIFLGEHVGWRRWSAVAVGFCGVLDCAEAVGAGNQLAGAACAGRQSRLRRADGGDPLSARHIRHGAGLDASSAHRCCSAR